MRIINLSNRSGVVQIYGIDDAGTRIGPVDLSLDASEMQALNTTVLEQGDDSRGLPTGLGIGSGDWRLELVTDLNIEPTAYLRTSDGFVTSMHDTAARLDDGRYHIPFFNPASNRSIVSALRLINPSEDAVTLTIDGRDETGAPPPDGTVRLTLGAGQAHSVTAQELEEGGSGLTGRFGNGAGKWRLYVSASSPIIAMSLLQTRSGHLTNLSTPGGSAIGETADSGGTGNDFADDQLDDFNISVPRGCSQELEVCVRDHQCEDGDELRVSVNDVVVFSGELFNARQCFEVPVMEGRNTVELYALNGTAYKGLCNHSDVNTGQIDVSGGTAQSQTWAPSG